MKISLPHNALKKAFAKIFALKFFSGKGKVLKCRCELIFNPLELKIKKKLGQMSFSKLLLIKVCR